MINENIFRAYDIRGKADEDLNDEIIRKIGIVLSEKILKTGQFSSIFDHIKFKIF